MHLCSACGTRFDGSGWACPACGFEPGTIDDFSVLAPDLAQGNVEDARYRYAELASAEAGHFWFVARRRLLVWVLETHFPSAQSFFDLGCGSGGVLAAIRGARPALQLTAGDAHVEGLGWTRKAVPDASFVQLDLRRLPYDQEFDVVGAFDVIEHIDDDEAALREMFRTTRPGGGVILTVPQHPRLWSAVDDFSEHRRRYTRRELCAKVAAAGFVVERVTSFMSLLLPALGWVRLRRHDSAAFDPVAELRIGRTANLLLGAVCSAERLAIQLGVSLPAGGSLLLVGRRG